MTIALPSMSAPFWSLLLGVLLIMMMLTGAVLARLLLSSAMIYLGVGYVLGPGGMGVIAIDPSSHFDVLERVSEVALLISLFAVGLKMEVPLFDRRWLLSLRLAFISMTVTVALIAAVGIWGLGLPLGAAVLLGGILAPTDPVLASGVKASPEGGWDRVSFSLAGEGGWNDGTAFPFVMLGLGLLGRHPLGAGGWQWWAMDLLWPTMGGLVLGATLGTLVGRLVVHLRTRHHQAIGLDQFLGLGLVAVAYGAAQLCLASGFLAVFAAGLALQRVQEQPRTGTVSLGENPRRDGHFYDELSTHSHHASAAMTRAVRGFNEQLEKLAELAMVLLLGTMMPYVTWRASLFWFIPVFFVPVRSLAVWVGTRGEPLATGQRAMLCWFGIRGVGSLYYLMFALRHGLDEALAGHLVSLTLATVAISIVVHGISAGPLTKWWQAAPN